MFCITSLSNALTNQDGTPATQAGSHPYQMVTSVSFSTDSSGLPSENVKDVTVNLPAGLIGDPNASPKCTVEQLDNSACPAASQIGMLNLTLNEGSGPSTLSQALYNIVPPGGMPAQFGTNILVVNSFLDVSIRTGSDYGLTTSSLNISANLPVLGISATLWGVPADPSHDAQRVCPGGASPCSVTGPQLPLLTMPTACSSQLATTASADSWQSVGTFSKMSYSSVDTAGNPIGVTGCGLLSMSPSITAQPDTTVADSPAGLDVDLHVPQAPNTPTSLATPALKTAVVTLPPGFAISPAAADGLAACSEGQFGLTNASPVNCPNASKIGTAEIDTPIQADPLKGSIYLATPLANEFSSPLALYVAVQSDGVLVKLAGKVTIAPNGQLQTTFDNNPQLPFTDFSLDFFGGPRATFDTPESCGTFNVTSSLTPWNGGSALTPSTSFPITSGCVSGFSPTFTAGVSNPEAGAFTPFVLSFSRGDTDQELSGLTLNLPPGLLAKLAGVPLCSNSQANSATCPAATQVGTATTGAGPGPHPLFLTGKVYLTGPYKGAPYGLVVVVPAVAGPINLGNVIVRQTLNIDKTDAHVTVVSDPLPTSLAGIIPLRLRRIDIDLNRPNFMVNPTNCTAMQVLGTLTSTTGSVAQESSRFQVGGCGDLGLSPSLKLSLKGKVKKAGRHPTLNATLTQPSGQSHLKSVKVTLPLSLALDPKNTRNLCSVAAAAADNCPASTIVGKATAATPLLSTPLSGNVYLVQGIRTNKSGQTIKTLPGLLVPLRGALALDLTAKTSVSHNRLVTTFGSIPDTAVSRFVLTINGGSHGILVTTKNLCKSKQIAGVNETGQNGKTHSGKPKISDSCHK